MFADVISSVLLVVISALCCVINSPRRVLAGVQADALLDVMSAPQDEDDDDSYKNDRLYSNPDDSPGIAASSSLSGRGGAMQMVNFPSKKTTGHDMGVGP